MNRWDYTATRKGNEVFAHVLDDALAGQEITIPGVRVTAAKRYDDNTAVSFRVVGNTSYVRVPTTINTMDEILRLTVTRADTPGTFTGGTYTIQNVGNGLNVATQGGATGNGTQIIQAADNGTDASQNWTIQPDPNNEGYFQIKNSAGRCLSIAGDNTADGAQPIVWDCLGTASQAWYLDNQLDGNRRLIAKHAAKCLEVPGETASVGAALGPDRLLQHGRLRLAPQPGERPGQRGYLHPDRRHLRPQRRSHG